MIELCVRDNGRGISEKMKSHPMSLGLVGIRERVNYWGGSLSIQGTRNKGTVVMARIRLNSGKEADD
jgi:two-component system, NarL family, sensor histidine kinase UhpB